MAFFNKKRKFPLVVLVTLHVSLLIGSSCPHPQCLDFFAPFDHEQAHDGPEFCATYKEYGCCTAEMDSKIREDFQRIASAYENAEGRQLPEGCLIFLKDILCQECSPYAAHLYDAEATQHRTRELPGLCHSYCWDFHRKCSRLLPHITSEELVLEASANSTARFCQKMALSDVDYCFPDILRNDDLSRWVEEAQVGTGRSQCLCLEEFANNLRNPLLLIHANDNTHRVFIGEQIGVIHIFLENRTRLQDPFLDIRQSILTSNRRGDERGLLGGAFHPDFAENSRFFLFYSTGTSSNQLIRISEFTLMQDDMNKVNMYSEKVILEVDQPYANHNGGQLMFGLDGYLYASIGDGGAAGDPLDSGLDKSTLLGKIIRIDVDSPTEGRNYSIPPDNPFIGDNGTARPENYAYGIRNIWRCGIDRGDRKTGYGKGRIFCGDVGQNRFEEIDIIVKGGNYGWRGREGYTCYSDEQCNDEWLADEILPIHVYPHSVGKSVTGGHVYRGCMSPNLNGKYIFGDYVSGRLFTLTENETGTWDSQEICMADSSICLGSLINSYPRGILSFGEDEAGEVYVLATDEAKTEHAGGKVFKIVDPGRRGNPLECSGQKVDVEVNGPTIPFVPTAKDDKANPYIPGCPEEEEDRGVVSNETVCTAHFVFSGKVIAIKHFKREQRVRLQVLGIDRRLKHVPKIPDKITITIRCKHYECACPNLKLGVLYHLSGKYKRKQHLYIVNTRSFWHDFNWLTAVQIKMYSRQCRKQGGNSSKH